MGDKTNAGVPVQPGIDDLARIIVQHSSDGMIIQDLSGRIEWVNPAYTEMTGYALEEVIGRNPLEFILPPEETPSPEEIAAFNLKTAPGELKPVTKRYRHKDGHDFWVAITSALSPPDTPGGQRCILVCRDVTEKMEYRLQLQAERDRLAHQAERDPLTGLSNRLRLTRIFDGFWEDPDSDTQIGLLQLDLDRFKQVNDTHGHEVGDSVLLYVADTLSRLVASDDIAVRLGGDEFIIVRTRNAVMGEMIALAEEMIDQISNPTRYGGPRVSVGASIGIAIGTPATMRSETMMRHADYALYSAKNSGRGGVAVFDDTLEHRYLHDHQRRDELRRALKNGEFTIALQPLVNMHRDAVTGFECLIRWNHPTEGLLAPGAFLDMARELDLIPMLDFAVFEAALKAHPQLERAAGYPIRVGFNTDGATLIQSDFVDRVKWALDAHDIPPERLVVEVLETTMLDDDDNTVATAIRRLYEAGICVALDDFGVGYASLAHLAKLSINMVKIDRSLITDLHDISANRVITRAIMDLGRELGLDVIAEGVETADEAEAIIELGGDVMQGFWQARPMPLSDAIAWLRNRPCTQDAPAAEDKQPPIALAARSR